MDHFIHIQHLVCKQYPVLVLQGINIAWCCMCNLVSMADGVVLVVAMLVCKVSSVYI